MERPSKIDRPDFDIQPELAAQWLVDRLLSGHPGDIDQARQTLSHLARQPSPFVASQSLLEHHVDRLAHTLFEPRTPPVSTRHLMRGVVLILHAGRSAHRCLVVTLLIKAIKQNHEELVLPLVRRIRAGEELLAARRVASILLPTVPFMPALLPLGERLIRQAINDRAARQDDLRAIDRLLLWGGKDLHAHLSQSTLRGLGTLEGKISIPTECLGSWARRQALASHRTCPRS